MSTLKKTKQNDSAKCKFCTKPSNVTAVASAFMKNKGTAKHSIIYTKKVYDTTSDIYNRMNRSIEQILYRHMSVCLAIL